MIRVSVLYPSGEGITFDHDYYREKHMPLCGARLTPFGLLRYEIDRGLGNPASGEPPAFLAVCHFYFTTADESAKGLAAHGAELAADVPNYTNAEAVIQTSEIVV
jgi:uncharacterized protein (TIGR02118 family)